MDQYSTIQLQPQTETWKLKFGKPTCTRNHIISSLQSYLK
uniref:Uncharacterized protein n=1 Tax=Arundo donax TaxID=35708 RepID=A0A0A9BKA3_ARUDO